MLVVEDAGGATAVRYDHQGTQLSATPFYPPFGLALAAIDPFGRVAVAALSHEDPVFGLSGIWVMEYDGLAGCEFWPQPAVFQIDQETAYPTDLRFSADGDVVLVGGVSASVLVRKLDGRSGDDVFAPILISGAEPGGLALDAAGNLFVSVGFGALFSTRKYNGIDGSLAWGPIQTVGIPVAAAVDPSGNLVVTGLSAPAETEIATCKYNGLDGTLLWQSSLSVNANAQVTGPQVAIDASGDIVISTTALLQYPAVEQDTFELDGSSAAVLWGPVAVPEGSPTGLQVAGNGDPVVTGSVWESTIGPVPTTWRYNRTTGDQIWTSQLPPLALSGPPRSVVASDGNLIVAASFVAGTDVDVLVEAQEPGGGFPLWSVPFTGSAGAAAGVTALAVSPDGGIVAGGYAVNDGLGYGGFGDYSLCAAKYDPTAGSLIWGPVLFGGQYQNTASLAVDATGDVFIAGYTGGQLNLLKYSGSTGALIWGPSTLNYIVPIAMQTDSTGDVILVANALGEPPANVLFKFAGATGTLKWGPVSYPGSYPVGSATLALDQAGSIFLSEALNEGAEQVVLKYSGDGSLLWGPVDGGGHLAVDSAGNVVATSGATFKYDGATGAVLWGPVNTVPGFYVALDSSNDVFVTGGVYFEGTHDDFATAKYRGSDGALLWGPVYFNGPGNSNDTPNAISVGSTGDPVVVGGSTGSSHVQQLAVVKYDGVTGAQNWVTFVTQEGQITFGGVARAASSVVVGGTTNDRTPPLRATGAFLLTALTESLGIATLQADIGPAACGTPYALSLAAENGTPAYVWTLVSGALPSGLSLGTDGTLSGTPSEEGIFAFRVRVGDSAGGAASRDFALTVVDGAPPLSVKAVSQSACQVLLSAPAGYSTYQWLPGLDTTPSITVSPNESTTYGLVAADATGCMRHGAIVVSATKLTDPSCAAPSITSISPQSGTTGTSVTITGSNFQPAAFGLLDRDQIYVTGVVGPSSLTGNVGPGLAPGTVADVFVYNPDTGTAVLPKSWLADFADVPAGNPFYGDVAIVALHGITVGCGNGAYCPQEALSRAQMAIFLLRALLGSSYSPPAATGGVFLDVGVNTFGAAWIEDLFHRGISGGCGGGNYCPSSPVSRAQMAVLLLKTKNGPSYSPPACTGVFADVECAPTPAFAVDWIEELYAEGITGGCGASPLIYCPGAAVNRGQMAALLVKTFGLQ